MDSHPEFTMVYEWLKCRICGFIKKDKIMYITMEEFLMGRDKANPLSDELKANAEETVKRVDKFMGLFGEKRKVSSGYRPAAINDSTQNAATKSNHLICKAADMQDLDGRLRDFVIKNLDKCKEIGLWMEDFRWTDTWVHFQTVPPKSGNRVYVPNTNSATSPNAWDGKYDKKYN